MSRSDEIEVSPAELALVDLLYEELDDEAAATARTAVEADPELLASAEAYRELRQLFRELPDQEPPAVVSAQLLHVAATRTASGSVRSAVGGGVLGWFQRLLQPMLIHPAMAAATLFVLVAGVAGTLYFVGDVGVSRRRAPSTAAPPTGRAEVAPVLTPPGESERGRKADLDLPTPDYGDDVIDRDRGGLEGAGGIASETSRPEPRSRPRRKAPLGKNKDRVEDKNAILEIDRTNDFGQLDSTFTTDLAKKPTAPAAGGKVGSRGSATADPKPEVKGRSEQVIVVDTAPPPLKSVDDDREAPEQEETSAAERQRAVARRYHDQARQAARDGECDAVLELGNKIRKLDASYYDKVYLTDKQLYGCLRSQSGK